MGRPSYLNHTLTHHARKLCLANFWRAVLNQSVTWTWENKRNGVIDIHHQRRQTDMSTISGYALSMWSWNHSWYSETGTIRSWDRQRTRVIVMDKTNGSRTHNQYMHIHNTCNTWTTHATNTETTASTALYFFLSYFKQSCSLGLHGEPVCGARDCVRKIPPAERLSLLVFITRGKHKYCHRSYLLWSSWSESPLSTTLMWHLTAHR